MKKLLFLFALAFVSCNIESLIEGLSVHVAMPTVSITTPQVQSGTYTITKSVSVDTLNAIVLRTTNKNLDEVTDLVLSGVTVSIITPNTLNFSKFSYGKLIVSSQSSSVTVFDRQLNETGRSYTVGNLSANVKNIIAQARQGNKMIDYSLTITTASQIPVASWKIESSLAITP